MTSPQHHYESRSQDWADAVQVDGSEHPDVLPDDGGPRLIERSFAFVDLCSFTAFVDQHGPRDAIVELDRFRNIVRRVASRRGIRVAKWLGDGAMLVGLNSAATSATAVEIVGQVAASCSLQAHAGTATGAVLLFDGDDHVGGAANIAARLCDIAGPSEVLASTTATGRLPTWITASAPMQLEVRGVDTTVTAQHLTADDTVRYNTATTTPRDRSTADT